MYFQISDFAIWTFGHLIQGTNYLDFLNNITNCSIEAQDSYRGKANGSGNLNKRFPYIQSPHAKTGKSLSPVPLKSYLLTC